MTRPSPRKFPCTTNQACPASLPAHSSNAPLPAIGTLVDSVHLISPRQRREQGSASHPGPTPSARDLQLQLRSSFPSDRGLLQVASATARLFIGGGEPVDDSRYFASLRTDALSYLQPSTGLKPFDFIVFHYSLRSLSLIGPLPCSSWK